ncbi:transcriptional regulatory protein moc3 [Podospora australis]|uniref:Transcriptional regulatory protein moc3 n=1 Tax=Podospora australis TaxID=1536484 RepID=A0AAN7AKN0_9PEZI|nr:transcriptional regulatory protein moc3 [Podospora australis]
MDRIRKVKCDEAKPFCMRCTKTGRRCDGYLDAKTMSQRRRRSGALTSTDAGVPQAPLAMLYDWATADERRAFHFFQHVTAPSLSADLDNAFWRHLVLQICQSEPAVRHAVLAVSSLHEGMVQNTLMPHVNNDNETRSSFALYQYNRAIACLLDQMRTVNARPLVPLLTCVLFVCIELMQSKDTESLIHLEQGRQILSQLGPRVSGRSPEIDLIKQHLVPIYTRLSLTSLMLGGAPVPIPAPLKTFTEVPMVFENVDEVRYALYDFMDECLRFAKKSHVAKLGEIPREQMREFETEQDCLIRKLAKFNIAFSMYRSTKARDAPPGSIALLQIHAHTTFIWISTALSQEETVFDNYVDTFSAIIPLATEFMNTLHSPPPVREHPSNKAMGAPSMADTRRISGLFTFEMHVIAPLYFVAVKCRHPMIRRAALDLLRRNPARRENLWRANVMATIAERAMKLEEKHLRPRRPEGQPDSQSASPPDLSSSFPYTFGPGDAWASSIPDVPFPDNFLRMDLDTPTDKLPYAPFETMQNNPPVTTSCSASSTTTSSMDAGMSHDFGNLGGHMPIDPSLLFDAAEVSSAHSYSVAPSIASSLDDLGSAPTIFVGGDPSLQSSTMGSHRNNNAMWNSSPHPPPGIALEPPTPRDGSPFVLGMPSHSRSGSRQPSVGSPSVRSEDSPPMHPIDLDGNYGGSGMGYNDLDLDMHFMMGSQSQPPMMARSGDAPYDVPEKYRVHESVIGPGKEDGSSWVMMFRKLGGLDAEWDVLTEYFVVA